MSHKYGYKGSDSAEIGVWNWLIDLQVRKVGGIYNHKRKDDLLIETIVSGFCKDYKSDRYSFIQRNWSRFKEYSNKVILEVAEMVESEK